MASLLRAGHYVHHMMGMMDKEENGILVLTIQIENPLNSMASRQWAQSSTDCPDDEMTTLYGTVATCVSSSSCLCVMRVLLPCATM